MKALPSNTKRRLPRVVTLVAAAAALGIAAACSPDSISAPASPDLAAQNGLIGSLVSGIGGTVNGVGGIVNGVLKGLIPSKGLLRTAPLKQPMVVSKTIGRNGGEIELPSAGLKLKVPSGAITGNPITIIVTAVAGNMVAYEFQPHGTKFAKPLEFEQTLEGTNWNKLNTRAVLNGGYFKTLDQLDLLRGLGLLDETYPVTVKSNRVMFNITHFSGYMVSTGRSDSDEQQF
jgi:hypothetical protein